MPSNKGTASARIAAPLKPEMSVRGSIVLFTLGIFSAGCYSLAADITPPPGYVYATPPPTSQVTTVNYIPFMPADPASGAAIYVEKCEPCHGQYGLGDGPEAAKLPNPVAVLADPALARSRTPQDWFRLVTEGNLERYMPPFVSLTERERWDVVAYVLTLGTDPANVEHGLALYQSECAACHGTEGQGTEAVPAAVFADEVFMAVRSAQDLFDGSFHADSPSAPAFDDKLDETIRWSIVAALRTMSFQQPGQELEASSAAVIESASGTPQVSSPEGEALGEGLVAGRVLNASGGELPAGLEAVLHGFDQFVEVFTQTAPVEADGSFAFSDVRMPEGRAFIVSVDYQRGTFTSDVVVAEPQTPTLFLSVDIYESTSDTSALTINRLHLFFEFVSPETLRVAVLILISNPAGQLVAGPAPGEPTLSIRLPAEARNLQFEEGALGAQFVLTETGFGDLRSIPPGVGQHQILFSYDVPYDRGVELNQPVDLPVEAQVVLLPDVGVVLASASLVAEGEREVEGVNYQLFTGRTIPAGESLTIELSGRPRGAGTAWFTLGGSGETAIGAAVLGLTLISAGGYIYLRRRREYRGSPNARLDGDDSLPEHILAMSAEELMDAIIALDDRFKAGDLPEDAYQRKRAQLKDHLRERFEPQNRE